MNLARQAIETLAIVGWNKGDAYNDDGNMCLGSVLSLTFMESGVSENELQNTCKIVREVIKENFSDRKSTLNGLCIPDFNDHEDTVIEDVIMVLEKTAAKLDELGGTYYE